MISKVSALLGLLITLTILCTAETNRPSLNYNDALWGEWSDSKQNISVSFVKPDIFRYNFKGNKYEGKFEIVNQKDGSFIINCNNISLLANISMKFDISKDKKGAKAVLEFVQGVKSSKTTKLNLKYIKYIQSAEEELKDMGSCQIFGD